VDARDLLSRTAAHAADFLESLDERAIEPRATVDEVRAALGGPVPEGTTDPTEVIEELVAASDPGVVGISERGSLAILQAVADSRPAVVRD